MDAFIFSGDITVRIHFQSNDALSFALTGL